MIRLLFFVVVISVFLFVIYRLIDAVCYMLAKYPERQAYSNLPAGGIRALWKLGR